MQITIKQITVTFLLSLTICSCCEEDLTYEDSKCRVEKQTDDQGYEEYFFYDETGKIVRSESENSTSSYSYNQLGLLSNIRSDVEYFYGYPHDIKSQKYVALTVFKHDSSNRIIEVKRTDHYQFANGDLKTLEQPVIKYQWSDAHCKCPYQLKSITIIDDTDISTYQTNLMDENSCDFSLNGLFREDDKLVEFELKIHYDQESFNPFPDFNTSILNRFGSGLKSSFLTVIHGIDHNIKNIEFNVDGETILECSNDFTLNESGYPTSVQSTVILNESGASETRSIFYNYSCE